jgi:hypothetical protein
LTSKKKRRKETATSEKNTTASSDEEDTTEQGTSTEAIHNESKVMFSEKSPDVIFWNFLRKLLETTLSKLAITVFRSTL